MTGTAIYINNNSYSTNFTLSLISVVTIQVKKGFDYKNKSPFEQLALSFMTSLTITGLNSIVPIIFKKMVTYENYSFAVEVNFTLGR